MESEVVWIIEDNAYAYLIKFGAYFSVISRSGDPGDVELIENTEFELWKERAIEYESE